MQASHIAAQGWEYVSKSHSYRFSLVNVNRKRCPLNRTSSIGNQQYFYRMIAIEDVLISDDVVKSKFVCDLDACLGACCWEGEWGAPLLEEEVAIIESVWDKVSPLLTEESRKAVKKQGFGTRYGDEGEVLGTPLIKNGACAYLIWDGKGIGKCAFEVAHAEGIIDWPKPISCHMYPIRVKYREDGSQIWNYNKWNICAPACKNGKKLDVPLYKFLQGPILRAKGQDFYDQLNACAEGVE